MHGRKFNSTLGLYTLAANSTHYPLTSQDTHTHTQSCDNQKLSTDMAKCPQEGRGENTLSPWFESHCLIAVRNKKKTSHAIDVMKSSCKLCFKRLLRGNSQMLSIQNLAIFV